MSSLKQRNNHKMSGGEKGMAAIAIILAMHPEAPLMDEPSIALDPCNRRRLIHILKELPMTKVIASHDLDLIQLSHRSAAWLSDKHLGRNKRNICVALPNG